MLSPIFPTDSMATISLSEVNSGHRCLKCGIIKKSGKRSCCARGGAWFKNCGDADDTKFDHTWAEGIEACADFAAPNLVKTPLQVMIRRVGLHISRGDSIFNSRTMYSEDQVGLMNIVVYIFIFVTPHLHM